MGLEWEGCIKWLKKQRKEGNRMCIVINRGEGGCKGGGGAMIWEIKSIISSTPTIRFLSLKKGVDK